MDRGDLMVWKKTLWILVVIVFSVQMTWAYTAPSYNNVASAICNSYTANNYNNILGVFGESDSCVANSLLIDNISPADGATITDSTPDLTFIGNGSKLQYEAEIFINSTGYGTNSTALNNTQTTITVNDTLLPGYYSWYVNYTNGTVTNVSDTWYFNLVLPDIQFNFTGCSGLSFDTTLFEDEVVNATGQTPASACLSFVNNGTFLGYPSCHVDSVISGNTLELATDAGFVSSTNITATWTNLLIAGPGNLSIDVGGEQSIWAREYHTSSRPTGHLVLTCAMNLTEGV